MLFVRVIHLISFQPRLSVISGALALALPDLVHFALVLGVVLVMMASAANVVLGPEEKVGCPWGHLDTGQLFAFAGGLCAGT